MTSRRTDAATSPAEELAPVRPKRLPLVGPATDPVPVRMVNEVLYCERLAYLEWVQREFEDNHFTVEGRGVHARADRPGGELPTPEDDEALAAPWTARSVWLTSAALGLTGKIDVIEGTGDGEAVPVEYKRGKAPDVPEGAWLPERAQLCAHALLLREAGYRVEHGEIYFAGSRRRVTIAFDAELETTTRGAIARLSELAAAGELPPPLVDSPKCNGCSLVNICLPDEVNLLRALEAEDATAEDSDDARVQAPPVLRQLHPARDDRSPVYVQEAGARVGLSGEELVITSRDGSKVRARLPNTSQVNLLGNVQITTQAVRELLDRNIPLNYFTGGGWHVGRTLGHESGNAELRLAQLTTALDPEASLALARTFVAAKIHNCRTLLRRNAPEPDAVALKELVRYAKAAAAAPARESLLGVEGTAARVYFGQLKSMLKTKEEALADFDMEGRNRRPPRDPVNALLSYCYGLLTKDVTHALRVVGLEPIVGFYHQPRFGRPSLALDLMEELRPVIADSVVITVINTQVVQAADFQRHARAVSLRSHARKRVLQAYERRMAQEATHPLFGYRISMRRMLEVQARLLTRHLLGELDAYPGYRVR